MGQVAHAQAVAEVAGLPSDALEDWTTVKGFADRMGWTIPHAASSLAKWAANDLIEKYDNEITAVKYRRAA